jgi:hypothetical protein
MRLAWSTAKASAVRPRPRASRHKFISPKRVSFFSNAVRYGTRLLFTIMPVNLAPLTECQAHYEAEHSALFATGNSVRNPRPKPGASAKAGASGLSGGNTGLPNRRSSIQGGSMHQRLPKTVLAALQQHGHRKPVLSCGRCRSVLADHAQRKIVIPTLRRLTQREGVSMDDVMAALSKIHNT